MLLDLGASHVDMASNGEEVIERCSRTSYDVVLSDYNLGNGRNGQHVLEELRYKNYLSPHCIYIIVSAEASRNIVMSSYDSVPDDYLMKPITSQMLHNRLERLLKFRLVFSKVQQAIANGKQAAAIELLIDMSLAEDRYSTHAQKLLGELFIDTGAYKKAEKLYMRVLEVRELDWARLGLAKAKFHQGDLQQAGNWLEKIIEDNYLYLPAYDVLCENWLAKGQADKAQQVMQNSVDVSPMSILRQKQLADLAVTNKDFATAVEALRKVAKLGKLSCYGKPEDKINLARAASEALENDIVIPASVVGEVMDSFEEIDASDQLSLISQIQMQYIAVRMLTQRNLLEKAKNLVIDAEAKLSIEDSNIDIEIDHIRALISLKQQQKVTELLARLKEIYADDQEALEKLDPFMDEPVSDANKAMVAEVNKEGIELYNHGEFDQALSCFDRAIKLFPNHVGLRLNVVQALIGKLKANPSDAELHEQCRSSLESIHSNIDEDNHQYKRFMQLRNMAKGFYESV